MNENHFYLSPICTKRLGDALISISNMYATLSRRAGCSIVYYHHWPMYYKKLWPHINHPNLDIRFQALEVPNKLLIDDTLEERLKPSLRKAVNRSDFGFHPSTAYSKIVCKLHPFLSSELKKLSIPENNILSNCSELANGNKYVEFNQNTEASDLITYQGKSIDLSNNVRFNFNIESELIGFEAKKFVDVSHTDVQFEKMLELIASAKVHVGIDSAPMHIALAMGKPVVALWDSIDGEKSIQWIYYIYRNYHDKIWLKKIGDVSGLSRFASSSKVTAPPFEFVGSQK